MKEDHLKQRASEIRKRQVLNSSYVERAKDNMKTRKRLNEACLLKAKPSVKNESIRHEYFLSIKETFLSFLSKTISDVKRKVFLREYRKNRVLFSKSRAYYEASKIAITQKSLNHRAS